MNSTPRECPACRTWEPARTFETPADYRQFVRQLLEACEQNQLVITRSDAPLESMLTDPWPNSDDTFVHEFACRHCQRPYQLYVNVWNGRNWWKPDTRMPG